MKYVSSSLFKLSIAALLLVFVGCKKYEDMKIAKTGWNPNLAIPIGHAKFGVYDVLASLDSNDLVVIDPVSGQVALVYSSEIASFDAGTIVQFGTMAQSIDFSLSDFAIPVSATFSGNANSFKTQQVQINAVNGIEMDSIFFKSGTLDLHLETDLKHDISAVITFPDLTQGGVPLSRTINKTYSGTVPQVEDIQVDLTDVYGDFTLGGTSFNQMNIQVQVSVMGTGNEITGTENFSMDFAISNADYHHVNGYFGQQLVGQTSDSVLLRIFQNASDGVFELRNPAINFQIDNSFGFPIDIDLANLKTINVSTGVQTQLLNYPTVINVNYPTQIGQSAVTNFTLDDSNTDNLSTVISPTPKYFSYEIGASANPANNPAINNFIEENSRFVLRAEVDLPLDGLAYGFDVSDTVDFNFTESSDLIESVMFRIIVDNGFPVRLGTQIIALDENNNVKFTLLPAAEDIVEPAQVDANGVVSTRAAKTTDITLTRTQIDQLSQVKKLIIYGEAATTDATNGTMVKFFDYYDINIKLAMQIQGSASF